MAGPLYAAGGGQLSFGTGGTIAGLMLVVVLYIGARQAKQKDA